MVLGFFPRYQKQARPALGRAFSFSTGRVLGKSASLAALHLSDEEINQRANTGEKENHQRPNETLCAVLLVLDAVDEHPEPENENHGPNDKPDDTGEEVPSDQIVKVLRDLPGPRFQRIDRRSATVTSARLTTLPVARGVDVRAVVRWSLSDAFVRIPLIPTPASTT